MFNTYLAGGALLVVLACSLTGCATVEPPDWSSYDGPGREHFQKEEAPLPDISDPLEPMNRAIGGFNHGLMMWVVRPVAWVYRKILPRYLRTRISNALTNARYPVRLAGNLLQADWSGSWDETERFGINTTVGVAGLWDPATHWEFESSKEDVGQAFGVWGWRNSTYLVVPLLGPSTIRDGIGSIGDAAVDPMTYLHPAFSLRSGHPLMVDTIVQYQKFVSTNYDPYQLGRLLYVLSRELQIDDYSYSLAREDTGQTETLETVFLAPEDPEFRSRGKTRKVVLPSTGSKLRYTCWMQPEPAPIVFILPGTAGHRLGSSSLALAEIVYENGDSAVTISSSMNYEFIESASTVAYPGFAPADAHDVHVALDAIHSDIERRHVDHITERRLAGISMGGMHTLLIAAAENDPDQSLMDFDVYLALNSPVSFQHSVQTLDRFFNAPMALPSEERRPYIAALLRKVLDLASGQLDPGVALPFTSMESEYLIGLSFRLNLANIIHQTEERNPERVLRTQPSFWHRSRNYSEIYQFSFMEYVYAFVLPSLAAERSDVTFDEAGARSLFALCDLHHYEDQLRRNKKVCFISNRNDFLLEPQDMEWAQQVFGNRAGFFESGGHLGNLHKTDIQEVISSFVEERVPR